MGFILNATNRVKDVKMSAYRTTGAFNTIFASGDFDGGTLEFELSVDGEIWFDLVDLEGDPVTLGAKGYFNLETKARVLRITLDGGSDPEVLVEVR